MCRFVASSFPRCCGRMSVCGRRLFKPCEPRLPVSLFVFIADSLHVCHKICPTILFSVPRRRVSLPSLRQTADELMIILFSFPAVTLI